MSVVATSTAKGAVACAIRAAAIESVLLDGHEGWPYVLGRFVSKSLLVFFQEISVGAARLCFGWPYRVLRYVVHEMPSTTSQNLSYSLV